LLHAGNFTGPEKSAEKLRTVSGQVVERIAAEAPDPSPTWFSAIERLAPQQRQDPQLVKPITRRAATSGHAKGVLYSHTRSRVGGDRR